MSQQLRSLTQSHWSKDYLNIQHLNFQCQFHSFENVLINRLIDILTLYRMNQSVSDVYTEGHTQFSSLYIKMVNSARQLKLLIKMISGYQETIQSAAQKLEILLEDYHSQISQQSSDAHSIASQC